MNRRLKEHLKLLFRKIFEAGQNINMNILPCHWYSEVPYIKDLRSNDYWKSPYSMFGIHGIDIADQLAFLGKCCKDELIDRQKKQDIYAKACRFNGETGFGPIEGDFLYCFIRTVMPLKIVQVGCGVSTAVMLLAAEEAGYSPEIICIDPYPTRFLIQMHNSGKIKLVQEKAQLVPIELLLDMGTNGFLFIDSTHTVKPGSEVNRLILEVLPRLAKGIWVHFHDIYFPYDYSRNILTKDLFFTNESVLLHSFLINNRQFSLMLSLSMLHYSVPEKVKEFLPNYDPEKNECGLALSKGHFPSSLYLKSM